MEEHRNHTTLLTPPHNCGNLVVLKEFTKIINSLPRNMLLTLEISTDTDTRTQRWKVLKDLITRYCIRIGMKRGSGEAG